MIPVKICAGCLDTSGKMYQINKGEAHKLYSILSGLKTSEVHNMPEYLCHICLTTLKRFQKFRKKCQIVLTIIKSVCVRDKKLTIEAIKAIDKKDVGLEPPLSYMDMKKSNIIFIDDLPIVPEVRGPFQVLKFAPGNKNVNKPVLANDEPVELRSESSSDDEMPVKDKQKKVNENKYEGSDGDKYECNELEDNLDKKETLLNNSDISDNEMSDRAKSEENISKNDFLLMDINNTEEYELLIVGDENNFQFETDSVKAADTIEEELSDSILKNCENYFEETINQEEYTFKDNVEEEEEYVTKKNPKLLNSEQKKSNFKLSQYFHIYKMPISEQIEQMLKRQETTDYINARYKCDYCFRSTQLKTAFENHMKLHDMKISGQFQCEVCKKCLPKKTLLNKHIQRSHAFKFKCKECDIMFFNISRASRHCRVEHRTQARVCQYCDMPFHSEYSHEDHLRSYHSKESCYICGESYVNKRGVAIHMHYVHGQKVALFTKKNRTQVDPQDPNNCLKCDIKFKDVESFEAHMKGNHKKRNKKSLHLRKAENSETDKNDVNYCSECDTKFLNTEAFIRHLNTNSNHIERKKKMWPKRPRVSNKGTSSDDKPKANPRNRREYVCSVCTETIFGYQKFEKHYAELHPNDPMPSLFVCEICGKGFKKAIILDCHMRCHVEKAFCCALCGGKFTLEVNLKRHMKIHTGEKPFQCDRCPYRCRQKHTMKIHIQTVHLKIPYAPWKAYSLRKREKRLMIAMENAQTPGDN